jgi:hypothetical protein
MDMDFVTYEENAEKTGNYKMGKGSSFVSIKHVLAALISE